VDSAPVAGPGKIGRPKGALDPQGATHPQGALHPQGAGAFFGRRKGKTLRPHHASLLGEDLDRLRLDLDMPFDRTRLFQRPVEGVHLEIGFGGGEHLALRAAESPNIGFIGCEAFVNGTAKLLALAEAAHLDNLRLWDDDAAHIVGWLPPASVARAFLLYPDPWPKRRHRKRRFLGEAMIARLARILEPGAELCFATDIDDYAATTLARFARSPDFIWTAERAADWQEPWPRWQSTRYERKALREGRAPTYLTFRRIGSAAPA
jgi:tRNA (guanine-N7-)-methyltransferase